jgi:ribosome biogenesis protein BRX1
MPAAPGEKRPREAPPAAATKQLGEARRAKKKAKFELKKKASAAPAAVAAPVAPAAPAKPISPDDMLGDVQLRRATTDKVATNKQKCLVLGSRSMTSKSRHLLVDLRALMPHSREHAKIGTADNLGDNLVQICSLHHCNSLMFIEAHRHDVAFMWLGQAPAGPSVKFQIGNVHTADELRMVGNCLKYSRPLLHFDKEFETLPHLRVVKSLLQMNFNTPRYHPLSKPFVDHILCFFHLDNHIWFRNYQIIVDGGTTASNGTPSLMEIGPRFTMEPICILNGCCRGSVLWKSKTAMPPTEVRKSRLLRQTLKAKENEYVQRKSDKHKALNPEAALDPLAGVFQ